MAKFIKVPDGIIRADLIKRVIKYEKNRHEGGTYYGVKVEEEKVHEYEELDIGGYASNGQEKRRDELYNDIIAQLFESRQEKEKENEEFQKYIDNKIKRAKESGSFFPIN